MKKTSTVAQSPKRATVEQGPITIGMDLGDKSSRYCVLDGKGEVVREASVATTKKGMLQSFGAMKRCRIAMEVGTHSPWVSRLLNNVGHEVTRRCPAGEADQREQPQGLPAGRVHSGALGASGSAVLRPIRHRSAQVQADPMTIRVRASLVERRELVW